MAQACRQAVAVAGGAGGGIAEPAAGQDDRIRRLEGAAGQLRAGDAARFRPQAADFRVEADPDIQFPEQARQGPGDIAGLFGGGEDPLSALHGDRAAVFLQQGHHIPGSETVQGAVKEPGIAGNLGQEFIPAAIVGQVAAAFAGDIDLFAELFVFLQQGDRCPCPGSKNGGHHAGRAAPDDHNFCHLCFSFSGRYEGRGKNCFRGPRRVYGKSRKNARKTLDFSSVK